MHSLLGDELLPDQTSRQRHAATAAAAAAAAAASQGVPCGGWPARMCVAHGGESLITC